MFKMKVNCQSRNSVAINTEIPFVPIVGMSLYLKGFGGKFQITEVSWIQKTIFSMWMLNERRMHIVP